MLTDGLPVIWGAMIGVRLLGCGHRVVVLSINNYRSGTVSDAVIKSRREQRYYGTENRANRRIGTRGALP